MHFPECTTALSWIILLGKLVTDKTACLKLVLLFGTEFQKLERKQKLKHLIWSISWDFTISMISLIQINEYWWIRLCFGNHKDYLTHKDYLSFYLIFLYFFSSFTLTKGPQWIWGYLPVSCYAYHTVFFPPILLLIKSTLFGLIKSTLPIWIFWFMMK